MYTIYDFCDFYENFVEHNGLKEYEDNITYGKATELPTNFAFTIDDGNNVYEWWMLPFMDAEETESEYGNSAVLNFGDFRYEFFGRDCGSGGEDWSDFLKTRSCYT